MAQGYDKYELDNQTGQSFRFALNDILEASATQNSGDNSPNTTNTSYPYQVWVDTTNDIVKIRDAATAGSWYSLYSVDSDGKPTGAVAYGSYSISTNDTAGTGGTTAITVDTSQRVGIGTSSPGQLLEVENSSGNAAINITSSDAGYAELYFGDQSDASAGSLSYEHSSSKLRIYNGGSIRATVDSSGNVGIGATSPSEKLDVSSTGDIKAAIQTTSTGAGANAALRLKTGSYNWLIQTGDTPSGGLRFFDSTNSSERVRIDSSGRLLVGTATSGSATSYIQSIRTSGSSNVYNESKELGDSQVASFIAGARRSGGSYRYSELGLYKHSGITETCSYLRLQATDGNVNYFWTDDSDQFRVSTNTANIGTTGGTVVGTQTSDERIKNILGSVDHGLDTIKQIEPVRFALKSDPDTERLGFIAQQVQPLIPQSVFDTGEHIEGEPEDAPTKLGMEYVALIPVLVNAIKELSAEVDALKAQLS